VHEVYQSTYIKGKRDYITLWSYSHMGMIKWRSYHRRQRNMLHYVNLWWSSGVWVLPVGSVKSGTVICSSSRVLKVAFKCWSSVRARTYMIHNTEVHSTCTSYPTLSVWDSVWDRPSLYDGNGKPGYLESLNCVMWLWSLLQVYDVNRFSWSCVFKVTTWTLNPLSDSFVAYTAHNNSLSRN
jgi:hypothetical protein